MLFTITTNPGWTSAQVREWWHKNSLKDLMWQGSTDESNPSTFFSNNRSLMNGSNRIAYFPYAGHLHLEGITHNGKRIYCSYCERG